MKKLPQTFLAGVILVVPFAITIYVIWTIGNKLDEIGRLALPKDLPPGLGALAVIVAIFLVGLLTRFWVFRWLVGSLEAVLHHIPGIKTVYQAVRDLLKLFGRDAQHMGRVVLYTPPGTQAGLIAIQTAQEVAAEGGPARVAIFLPMAYMIGGPVLYVPAEHVQPLDLSVEQALKLCTTAHVGVPIGKELQGSIGESGPGGRNSAGDGSPGPT